MKLSAEQKRLVAEYNAAVDRGQAVPRDWPCLCGSTDAAPVCTYDRHGLWGPVGVCRRCGLVYATPRLEEGVYESFYGSDAYRLIYEPEADVLAAAENKFRRGVNRHIFEALEPLLRKAQGRTVLEFGCGGGWNLAHFQQAGYQVKGYDYSPELTAFGRGKGLDLETGSFGDISGKYDAIILCHVMEHFYDLYTQLPILLSHLKDDGCMYIEVPNIDNYNSSQPQNVHMYYFSPRTFVHYLGKCNLITDHVNTKSSMHMHSVFTRTGDPKVIGDLSDEHALITKRIAWGKFRSFVGDVLRRIIP
jgi:SAM-dependent methyltransferase